MPARLLVAVPFAAAVVAALFWAMGEIAPTCRAARPEHIVIDRVEPVLSHYDPFEPEVVTTVCLWPPPPKLVPFKPPAPKGALPRERFPPPEREQRLLALNDRCRQWPERRNPIWPKHARPGDYAVVEFSIGADGVPRGATIVESSNPKIHSDVVREVRFWRYRCADDPHAEPERKRVRIEYAVDEQAR